MPDKIEITHNSPLSGSKWYKLLADATFEAIFLTQKGICIKANASAYKMLGYAPGEIEGIFGSDLAAPASRELVRKNMLAGYEEPYEALAQRKNGTIFPVEIQGKMLECEGEIYRVTAVRDMTQQNETRAELAKSEQKYRGIFNDSVVAIFVFDMKKKFIDANKAGVELLGYSKEELLNMHIPDVDADPDATKPAHENLRKGGGLVNYIHQLRRKDGRLVTVLNNSIPIKDQQNKVIGLQSTLIDITRLHETEQKLKEAKITAERASAVKSEFLANMSHEIRTPLNGIAGFCSLLRSTELSPEQQEYLSHIEESNFTLTRLIDDIFDFSQFETDDFELSRQTFSLSELLAQIDNYFHLQAKNKGLKFNIKSAAKVPDELTGDTGRLQQVLHNICSNALKFTHQGEINLNVEVVRETDLQIKLKFSVLDTGIGITPEIQKKLFCAFVQGDNTSSKEYSGAGLGLVLAKNIVNAMNGETGMESVPGEGSTFWFIIPFKKEKRNKSKKSTTPITGKIIRVLVFEPDKTERKKLQNVLNDLNYETVCVTNREQVFPTLNEAKKKDSPFHIAILDTAGIQGHSETLSLGNKIKAEQAPGETETAFIFMASAGVECDVKSYRQAGFSAYFHNPIEPELLDQIIQNVLKNHRSRKNRTGPGAKSRQAQHATTEWMQNIPVLLVEDNRLNQKIATSMLQKLGCRVKLAENGVEAIEDLQNTDFDIVFMDCQMPQMDGYEATRVIRQPDSPVRNHSIPIVAMTANDLQRERDKCLDYGMNDYLSKPVSIQQISDMLDKWCHKQEK